MFMKHYAPNRCEPSIEALNLGAQGRCERRSEIFVKIQKKKFFFFFFFFGGGGGRVGGGWGQGGCARRIEVFVNVQNKKFFGWGRGEVGLGRGGGVRVDVNEELKFL